MKYGDEICRCLCRYSKILGKLMDSHVFNEWHALLIVHRPFRRGTFLFTLTPVQFIKPGIFYKTVVGRGIRDQPALVSIQKAQLDKIGFEETEYRCEN
jgi:hypothetical protein